MSDTNKVICIATWVRVAAMVSVAIPFSGFIALWPSNGFSSIVLGLLAIGIFAVLAVVDALVSRIILGDDSIRIISLFRKRIIPRTEILSVTWAAGYGVIVKLRNGGWIKIPNTGHNIQGQTNTFRAWLNRPNKPLEPTPPVEGGAS
jgi:hypothetical protein